MKRTKSRKAKVRLSRGKLIAICLGLGVLAFGVTLGVMLAIRGNLGCKEARNYADEILKTKPEVAEFLNAEIDKFELNDESQAKLDSFAAASDKVAQYMESLSASAALKNKSVAAQYDKAKEDFAKLEKVARVEKTLRELVSAEDGLNDEQLTSLAEDENEFLRKMADELRKYWEAAQEFAEKYADSKNVNEETMIEDYGAFQLKGEELLDNYAEASFRDIFGFSKDEVIAFYDSIEGLVSILNEKI
ncbi:hypothetical protein IJ102_01665 [Candidatus Saccharibacteria bacterium]|nr:hypothetical protein [Candidatus Saccharibacteria bacterium]